MAQRKDPIPDSVLKNKVTQQLANRGLRTPCRIHVEVRKGVLTLTGQVNYPHQRDAAMAAVRSIDGLSRIHEQIQVKPPAKHQYKTLPPLPKKSDVEVAAPEGETGETSEAATAETATSEAATAQSAPVASAPAAEAQPAAEAVADDSADFDLGPVRLAVAADAQNKTVVSATATAGDLEPAIREPAAGGETIEDGPNETDFDIGPAKLAAVQPAGTDQAAPRHQAPRAPKAGEQACAKVGEDDSSTTDFDFGPAPVNLRPAS